MPSPPDLCGRAANAPLPAVTFSDQLVLLCLASLSCGCENNCLRSHIEVIKVGSKLPDHLQPAALCPGRGRGSVFPNGSHPKRSRPSGRCLSNSFLSSVIETETNSSTILPRNRLGCPLLEASRRGSSSRYSICLSDVHRRQMRRFCEALAPLFWCCGRKC